MRPSIILCMLAAAAAADDGFDRSVDSYLASVRPGRHGGFVSVRLDVWMAVPRGTVASGGGPVDLRGDMDIGVLDESWQSLVAPVVGAGIGALVGLFGSADSGSNQQLAAMGAGAVAGAAITPFVLEPAVDLTAQYNFSDFGVRLDGFYYSADGDETLARPISFGGANFAAGQNVNSDFRVALARAAFLWTFLQPPDDGAPRDVRQTGEMSAALSVFAGGAWVRYDASIAAGGVAGSDTATVVLPQVGLLLEARADRWIFEVVGAGGGDSTNLWLDGRISAAYVIADLVSIRIGYRYIHAELESNGFAWDGSLDGFYFGVGFHF